MREFKGIQIPETARDWELFTSMSGSAKAARELTGALKRTLNAFDDLMGKSGEGIAKDLANAAASPDCINDAMAKHRKLGAQDTEPRYHAHQALIDYAKLKIFGNTQGYHPELGDWL
jgi:hypothetical protein